MSQTLLQYETVKDISRRFQVHKGTMREISTCKMNLLIPLNFTPYYAN